MGENDTLRRKSIDGWELNVVECNRRFENETRCEIFEDSEPTGLKYCLFNIIEYPCEYNPVPTSQWKSVLIQGFYRNVYFQYWFSTDSGWNQYWFRITDMLKEFQSFRKFAVLERSYILMSDHTNLFSGMPKLKIYILSEKTLQLTCWATKSLKKYANFPKYYFHNFQ